MGDIHFVPSESFLYVLDRFLLQAELTSYF